MFLGSSNLCGFGAHLTDGKILLWVRRYSRLLLLCGRRGSCWYCSGQLLLDRQRSNRFRDSQFFFEVVIFVPLFDLGNALAPSVSFPFVQWAGRCAYSKHKAFLDYQGQLLPAGPPLKELLRKLVCSGVFVLEWDLVCPEDGLDP